MKTSTQKIYDAITEQKIYKDVSEPCTRFWNATFFKDAVPQKTAQEYVVARERGAVLKGRAWVERVDEQSKKLFRGGL